MRLYRAQRPRAVLVAWDTLDAPTYRHEKFPAYQSGRKFDDALLEQLHVLPDLVAACGFSSAKAAGYEADDFLAAAVASEERRGGSCVVASGDRDVRVYRPDGTLQCGMGRERTLADDKQLLEKLGAKVISLDKRLLPPRVSNVCGAPTGRTNTSCNKPRRLGQGETGCHRPGWVWTLDIRCQNRVRL